MSIPQQLVTWIGQACSDAVFYRPTTERVVALTIDDVPTPNDPGDRSTQQILAAIANHTPSAQATFFVISSHLSESATILAEMLAAGHEIGNHGVFDSTHAWLDAPTFEQQLIAAHDCLKAKTPQPIRWYRPGRGLYTPEMAAALRRLSQREGYEIRLALASMVPIDTFELMGNPQFTTWYVSQFVFPGAILVLHGGSQQRCRNTAAVLPPLLTALHHQGYRVVTLSQLWELAVAP